MSMPLSPLVPLSPLQGNYSAIKRNDLESVLARWMNLEAVTQSVSQKEKNKYHIVAYIGEGNGNPLQSSCLGNPIDRGAPWAAFQGVAKSRTQLSDRLSLFNFNFRNGISEPVCKGRMETQV